jgi:hypothetical protein
MLARPFSLTRAYKWQPSPPARAHALRCPPLMPPRWARSSTSSCHRPSPPSSSLGLTQAWTVACWSTLRRCSSDFEPRRLCRRGHAATARWSHLRLSHHRQAIPGMPDRTPVPHVGLLRLWIAVGELASPPEGTVVKVQGPICEPRT